MRRNIGVALLLALSTVFANGQDVVFKNSRFFDKRGELHTGELVFLDADQSIVLREKGKVVQQVSFQQVQHLAYEDSSRHRVKEAVDASMQAWPLAPVLLPFAFTKERKHWFYVDYTDAEGAPRQLVLWLDKGKYKKVFEAASAKTAKPVDMLTGKDTK